MDFTKVSNIYRDEAVKILNVNTVNQTIDKISNEADINLVIINEVISGILKSDSTYNEIRQINKRIPIVSLFFI